MLDTIVCDTRIQGQIQNWQVSKATFQKTLWYCQFSNACVRKAVLFEAKFCQAAVKISKRIKRLKNDYYKLL